MAVAQDPLIDRIREILKPHFPEDTVDVSLSGVRDNVHVVVVSRAFDNMGEKQKQEYLWDLLDKSDLSDEEKNRISLILAYSPDDLK